jgi:acetyl-CoA carboxylase biotin carboxyl carrier protein
LDDKQLRDLIDYIAASGFVEFEIEREGFKLRLAKASPVAVPPATAPLPAAPQALAAAPVPPPQAPVAAVPRPEDTSLEVIPSPMVGTFYRAANPNADAFVEVGDRVHKGQVICIVEAMKLMNEIEADREGEIVEIPVANGQPVEFGEALFRLRPPA